MTTIGRACRSWKGWYEELVSDSGRERSLLGEYAPHADFLRSLSGRVLDVGGGAGLAARFLPPGTTYVVVDPSSVWKSPEWLAFGAAFRRDGPEPQFIEAGGEKLPFADADFDAVLSFWSLNHVEDPGRCISEMLRVLKPGAHARLVLEDTEPRWSDLILGGLSRSWSLLSGRQVATNVPGGVLTAAAQKWKGTWKIADDHIRVDERDVRTWVDGRARISGRMWLGGYLTWICQSRAQRPHKRHENSRAAQHIALRGCRRFARILRKNVPGPLAASERRLPRSSLTE